MKRLLEHLLGAPTSRSRHLLPATTRVVHGDPARLASWIDEPLWSIEALVAAPLPAEARVKVGSLVGGKYVASVAPVAVAAAHLERGANVTYVRAQEWFPRVRALVHRLGVELGLSRVNANIYLSPPGMGVPLHFDGDEVLVVQLVGRKSWRLAPAHQVQAPHIGCDRFARPREVATYWDGPLPRAMPAGARRVTLRPGSVLFAPRGTWHETCADEASLSLTIGLDFPMWSDVALAALRHVLGADPRWQTPATSADGSTGFSDRRRSLATHAATRLASLSPRDLSEIGSAAVSGVRRRAYRRVHGVASRWSRSGGAPVLVVRRDGESRRLALEESLAGYVRALLSARGSLSPDLLDRCASLLPRWARAPRVRDRLLQSLVDGGVLEVSSP